MSKQGIPRIVAEKIALEMTAERLVSLLIQYGNHEQGCMVYINGTCYCGWEELKAKVQAARDATLPSAEDVRGILG